jgi:hypothetical protein
MDKEIQLSNWFWNNDKERQEIGGIDKIWWKLEYNDDVSWQII